MCQAAGEEFQAFLKWIRAILGSNGGIDTIVSLTCRLVFNPDIEKGSLPARREELINPVKTIWV